MVAFVTRMPSGIPGALSRQAQAKVESPITDAAKPFTAYGVPGKIASGKFVPIEAGDAASVVYGFLVREYPSNSSQDGLGTSTPPTIARPASCLVSGYMTVKSGAGTPALGGVVYVRVGAAAAGKPIGGVEAAADGSNTIIVAGARFMGPADSTGNVEIAFNV